MTNILNLDKVSKSYQPGKGFAVKDFSLEIEQGEFFCLIGPSGCGKSTVLKLITAVEQPSGGTITKPESISMVFQAGALLPWLTSLENAAFGLATKGYTDEHAKSAAFEFLEMVNLAKFADTYPRQLSGGQKQRVGIARALAVQPQLLLLDEPFSALDTLTTEELHQDLLKIWKQTSTTILMVSHSLEEAVLLADRVGIMKEGKLTKIIDINLPRPRSNIKVEFLTDLKKLKDALHS